jgi:hypothetical protein
LLGRTVGLLVHERMEAGRHSVHFDASALPSGLYIYRLHAGGFTESRKLVVLK